MQEIDKEYVRKRINPLLQSLKRKNFDPCFFESAG